jgi:hypothetical protein
MGYETVTTVTCDNCGKDISAESQYAIQASVMVTSAPAPPPGPEIENSLPGEGESAQAGPVPPPIPFQQSGANAVFCEEHGKGIFAKVKKLVAPAEK